MEESQPKISKHIAKIRAQKLVNTNRNEQFIYYSLNRENELLVSLLETMKPQLESTLPFEEDLRRLSNLDSFVCSR